MLLCSTCYNNFKPENLRKTDDVYYCPCAKCNDIQLVEIDDQLADPFIEMWKVGITTSYSCAGHLWEEMFQPYVIFRDEEEQIIDNFKSFINLFNTKYKRLQFSEIEKRKLEDEVDGDIKEYFTITLTGTPNNETVIEKLETQNELILFLYELAGKVKKIVEENEKNSSS